MMRFISYNLFPIALLVFAAYCLSIGRSGFALIGFIMAIVGAVQPKTGDNSAADKKETFKEKVDAKMKEYEN